MIRRIVVTSDAVQGDATLVIDSPSKKTLRLLKITAEHVDIVYFALLRMTIDGVPQTFRGQFRDAASINGFDCTNCSVWRPGTVITMLVRHVSSPKCLNFAIVVAEADDDDDRAVDAAREVMPTFETPIFVHARRKAGS